MGKMSQIHALAQAHAHGLLEPLAKATYKIEPDDPEFDKEVQKIAGEILVLYAEQTQLEKALYRIEYGNDMAYTTQRKEIDAIERKLKSVKKEIRTYL